MDFIPVTKQEKEKIKIKFENQLAEFEERAGQGWIFGFYDKNKIKGEKPEHIPYEIIVLLYDSLNSNYAYMLEESKNVELPDELPLEVVKYERRLTTEEFNNIQIGVKVLEYIKILLAEQNWWFSAHDDYYELEAENNLDKEQGLKVIARGKVIQIYEQLLYSEYDTDLATAVKEFIELYQRAQEFIKYLKDKIAEKFPEVIFA